MIHLYIDTFLSWIRLSIGFFSLFISKLGSPVPHTNYKHNLVERYLLVLHQAKMLVN